MARRPRPAGKPQGRPPARPVAPTSVRPTQPPADEIARSLQGINLDDTPPIAPGRTRRGGRRGRPGGAARPGRRRIVKWVVISLVVLLLAVAGYFAWRWVAASGNIFQGNIFDVLGQGAPLKQDEHGRSNIIMVGTTDDDPTRDGADLTDSIMVISLDQNKKNAYMISIPRDLYVQYGRPCAPGNAGKINAYFSCAATGDSKQAQTERMDALRRFVGNIIGLDIQYVVHVNSNVIRDAVNAVGGITVTIDSRDPRGILDSNFDWKCGGYHASRATRVRHCPPSGHYLIFPNGPAQLDGEKALWFSRARGVQAPTYGLEESNFDRERNQQKIITALREKAVSSGTLTNLGAVDKLVSALGNNLRTNFEAKEIKTLVTLGREITGDKIQTLPLMDEANDIHIVKNSTVGGASVVVPSAGTFSYKELRQYIRAGLSGNQLVKEKASVVVLNGSGRAGAAQTAANRLDEEGLTVTRVGNAPGTGWSGMTIYQLSDNKPATGEKLRQIYNNTPLTTQAPTNLRVEPGVDFVVVIGRGTAQ